jgi:trimeric autotransporter adhesin
LLQAVGAGNFTVTAAIGTVTASVAGTVANATLVSIAISPSSVSIASGGTQQFTATGTYSDHSTQNLTGSVTWASSNSSVLTINASGLATASTVSSATNVSITATASSVTAAAVASVTPTATALSITPLTATIAPNGTQQFTATATLANKM